MTSPLTASTAARSRPSAQLLRLALRLDAVVTGLNGAAYLLAAPLLADLLGLPTGWLRGGGVFLLAFAAAVWFVGARRVIDPVPAAAVVVVNALWALGSVAAVLADLGTPSTIGVVWAVLQAVVVAGFAALQVAGLRAVR